jgi:hypothetical protein
MGLVRAPELLAELCRELQARRAAPDDDDAMQIVYGFARYHERHVLDCRIPADACSPDEGRKII